MKFILKCTTRLTCYLIYWYSIRLVQSPRQYELRRDKIDIRTYAKALIRAVESKAHPKLCCLRMSKGQFCHNVEHY